MARRSVAEFLGEFVVPLVTGGQAHVRAPIDAEDLQVFEEDLPHASAEMVAVDEARENILAELVVRPPAMVLSPDDLHLAASLHNLLFLAHPGSDRWTMTDRRLRRVAEASKAFASQPLTRERTRVLARHALLHNIFDLTRLDTQVSWWTGSRRFLGQEPPGRLTAWPGLRRVHTKVDTAGFVDLFATPESMPIVSTILRRSPLTLVLGAPEGAPPVHWEDAVFLLRDAELARAIAYAALAPSDPDQQMAAPARYAAALEQMLERNPDPADVRAVVAFLVHLSALLAMGETRMREIDAPSPLLTTVLAPERAGQRRRGLSTFFALPAAAAEVEPALSEPPGLRDERRLALRWQWHRRQVRAGVGDAVIETLAARLARHLRPSAPEPDKGASPPRVEVGDNPS